MYTDEKWFKMKRKNDKCYLFPNEEDPYRTCKSKNIISKVMFLVASKVMFLVAIARPHFDVEGKEIYSGKIGIFPFITVRSYKFTI